MEAKKIKHRFLYIHKGEHHYVYKHEAGAEKDLFFCLIQAGNNSELNLTLLDALHLVRKITQHIRKNGGGDMTWRL